MKTILITENELEQLISRVIEKTLTGSLPEIIRKVNQKPVYTIGEMCDMLGVTRRHLQYLRDTNQIPYIQNGRKIYFRSEDLEDFFNSHKINP